MRFSPIAVALLLTLCLTLAWQNVRADHSLCSHTSPAVNATHIYSSENHIRDTSKVERALQERLDFIT